jgi:outer membrane protein assembly factor BamB
VFAPYYTGGYEYYPAAYSPRTQMMYSHAAYSPVVVERANVDCGLVASAAFLFCGVVTPSVSPLGVPHGVYGAINTVTGKVAWTIPIISSAPTSGMTVGGDLVFFGDSDGIFYAASAATGEILWVFDALTVPGAGGAVGGSPAVYEVNGVEYVANGFSGGSFMGDAVIAFALPSAVKAAAARSAAGKARVR